MSTPTLILGNNKWAIEEDNILGYAVEDRNGSYLPREISFTRGSDAMFTTSTGVIQQACWNLIGYSEEFDNAYWTKSNSSITTNTAAAPNGALAADKLVENTANSSHQILSTSATVIVGANYVSSIYAKAGERNWVLVIYYDGSTVKGRYFDLTNGVGGAYWAGATITNSITSVGNGWYRITLSYSATTTSNILGVYLANGDNSNSYLGNGTSGIYIWGAQLVQGSDALGYLRTTDRLNMPRVDSSTGTKTFLLEPQRTNLALYSEQFNDSNWAVAASTSVTANTTTAPNGTITADTAVVNATYQNACRSVVFGLTNGVVYTLSVYVKKSVSGGANNVRLSVNNTATWTGASTQKVALTNDWQRVTLTWTSNGTQAYFIIGSVDNTSATDTTCYGNIDIWGAQFEQGAYPTTYIPTQATTVTRIADSFIRSNIYTNGYIGQTGGTWFVELRNNISYTRDASGQFGIDTASGGQTNGFSIRNGVPGQLNISKYTSGSVLALWATADTTVKIAIKWNGSTADIFVNGTKAISATSFTTTAMEFLLGNGNDVPKYIPQMKLYSEPLSDAECISITTL